MNKLLPLFIFLSLFVLLFPSSVKAGLVTIKSDGQLVLNVLSEETSNILEPQRRAIEVKKVIDQEGSETSLVNLQREEDNVNLIISSGGQTRQLNVTGLGNELIEVEERAEVEKLVIGLKGNRFSLQQKGVVALTDYPIQIDARSAKFSLSTPQGDEYLSVLPKEATESALRTRLISKFSQEAVEISEVDSRLQYKISGEKVFNFADLFQYSIPVTVFVSASSGEIISIDSPTWFKYLKFLYV